MKQKPLAIDLFCGLGGWTEGLLAEGYDVVGFDIERHVYDDHRYPAQLVLQDILTLHGSQFRNAALIVASPPCQAYSWMAMPWSAGKARAAAIRADTTGKSLADLNRLFDSYFRIQKEASIAAGRHIPMVVENVRGAQPWVGRARWNFGSFYLFGDVPALMPTTAKAVKVGGFSWSDYGKPSYVPQAFNGTAADRLRDDGQKVPGFRFDGSGKSFQSASVNGLKGGGPKWDRATKSGAHGMARWTNPIEGTKNGSDWFGSGEDCSEQRRHGSKSIGRKMASAMIAKIPLVLSRYIAATYHP